MDDIGKKNHDKIDIEWSEVMKKKLCSVLASCGFDVLDETYVRYYFDKNIVLMNVEVEYPEEFGVPIIGTEDSFACEYRESLFEVVKTVVEDEPETWVVNLEMVYASAKNGEEEHQMSNSRFYVSMRSTGNWFEIKINKKEVTIR